MRGFVFQDAAGSPAEGLRVSEDAREFGAGQMRAGDIRGPEISVCQVSSGIALGHMAPGEES